MVDSMFGSRPWRHWTAPAGSCRTVACSGPDVERGRRDCVFKLRRWEHLGDRVGWKQPEGVLTSNTGGENFFPQVSADGRYIVFDSERTGSGQIWRMDSDSSNPKRLDGPAHFRGRRGCSPDNVGGLQKKGARRRASGRFTSEGGDPIRLNDAEADGPIVSPDGRTIAYLYEDPSANPPRGAAIMAFEGGPPAKRFDIPQPERESCSDR